MNHDTNLTTSLDNSWEHARHLAYLKYATSMDAMHWDASDRYSYDIAHLGYMACVDDGPENYYTGI